MKKKKSGYGDNNVTVVVYLICFLIIFLNTPATTTAQKPGVKLWFMMSTPEAKEHLIHVVFHCEGIQQQEIQFKLPAWTTGYYQIMNFADYVQNFTATTPSGEKLKWQKKTNNSWTVETNNAKSVFIYYDVKGTRPFVASNYVDEERAYISPAGVFIYPDGYLRQPVELAVVPYFKWSTVATGLDSVKSKRNVFLAKDYDVLYDSPILEGNLESFPSFTVKNIPHYFIAYKPGEFDKKQFMDDLKKIVTAASDIIGDIPYKHYSFLAIGPGGGGIEHLNSASVAFSGDGLNTKEGKTRMYNFLAHEYFHHYNVKRIRPIELGPFDYDSGSRTKMLWLSEGITVYYEYIILKRAGFTSMDDLLKTFSQSIKDYESKPGRNFQTPADASYNTWSDGPFGRTGDGVNKTISPYDKGPILGILLDFKIRHETKNKKSLDDIMRLLYNKYYKQLGRGFTEDEFRSECEKIAGTSLADYFDYIYTLKLVDYPSYLKYAGLSIDTVSHKVPGPWLGITIRDINDTLVVTNSEWQSPAWKAGVRGGDVILSINGAKINSKSFNELLGAYHSGDKITVSFSGKTGKRDAEVVLGEKNEPDYTITPMPHPDALQSEILRSWSNEK